MYSVTVSFVPKTQRAMMGSVCEGGINCNMSSFQLEMRYLQKALCNKHLWAKVKTVCKKSEGTIHFSEAPSTSSEEIWRVDKIWWQLSVSSRWLRDHDPSSTTLPITTIMLIFLLWLVTTSLPIYWSWPSLISSKCYIDIKIVLQGCVTPSLCWDLDLLHVNDIHVRMEETNKYSAACRSSTFNLKTKWIFAIKYSFLFSPTSSVLLRLGALAYIFFSENGGG